MPLLTAFALLAVPAAQDIDLPACGRPLRLSRALLAAIPDDRFLGAEGAKGDGFLVGDLTGDAPGSALFVRRAGRWRAYSVGPLLTTIALYRSTRSGAAFAWHQIQQEGAAPHFEQLYLASVAARPRCDKGLAFPPGYTSQEMSGEFTHLDFNLAPNGHGAFLATGHSEDRPWRYTTRNYGVSWSAPAHTRSLEAGPGAFERIDKAPPSLIASLRRSVR